MKQRVVIKRKRFTVLRTTEN